MTTMTVVCAWCGKPLGTKDGKGNTGITHGICKVCAAKVEKELAGKEVKYEVQVQG